jgi:hypothetical protein
VAGNKGIKCLLDVDNASYCGVMIEDGSFSAFIYLRWGLKKQKSKKKKKKEEKVTPAMPDRTRQAF